MTLFRCKGKPMVFNIVDIDERELQTLKKLILKNGGDTTDDDETIVKFTSVFGYETNFYPRAKMYNIKFITDSIHEFKLVEPEKYRLGTNIPENDFWMRHFLYGDCSSRIESMLKTFNNSDVYLFAENAVDLRMNIDETLINTTTNINDSCTVSNRPTNGSQEVLSSRNDIKKYQTSLTGGDVIECLDVRREEQPCNIEYEPSIKQKMKSKNYNDLSQKLWIDSGNSKNQKIPLRQRNDNVSRSMELELVENKIEKSDSDELEIIVDEGKKIQLVPKKFDNEDKIVNGERKKDSQKHSIDEKETDTSITSQSRSNQSTIRKAGNANLMKQLPDVHETSRLNNNYEDSSDFSFDGGNTLNKKSQNCHYLDSSDLGNISITNIKDEHSKSSGHNDWNKAGPSGLFNTQKSRISNGERCNKNTDRHEVIDILDSSSDSETDDQKYERLKKTKRYISHKTRRTKLRRDKPSDTRKGIFRRQQYRKPFTGSERNKMLQYLIKTKCIHMAKGLKIWKEMINDGYLTFRTPQSLQNHFQKYILPNIENAGLDHRRMQKFLDLKTER